MNDSTISIDWQALFFDGEERWPHRLQRLAERRLGKDPSDAEAAYNFAFDAVSADDWRRLQAGYKGLGSPQGFLGVTLARLVDDYAVQKYGKKRPPKWLQRLGGYWKRVYEFLCVKRMEKEAVVAALCARGEFVPEDIRYAISQVRSRVPGCGQRYGEVPEAPETLDREAGGATDPSVETAADEISEVLGILSGLVGAAAPSAAAQPRAFPLSSARLTRLRDCLGVSDVERLLLRLVYHDGFAVARAARSLKMHEQNARRMHKRLVSRMRACLDEAGFN